MDYLEYMRQRLHPDSQEIRLHDQEAMLWAVSEIESLRLRLDAAKIALESINRGDDDARGRAADAIRELRLERAVTKYVTELRRG